MSDRSPTPAEIFDAVLELSPTERSAFLDDACRTDPELRAEVERLLDAVEHARTEDLLPPLSVSGISLSPVGRRIAPYTLLEQIGEGGMGEVYLAEREDVGKRVALKLVRFGGLASSDATERFLLERQVLARLQHPNIAQLLDAGWTEDRLPYLVMEYVEGEPIHQFCDSRRLGIAERLRLFLGVCEAVQYAHRSLVVHRDLKPSNILVTPDGEPKLLDFGIAKLLDDEDPRTPALTRTHARVLTPEYASPEQVRGETITVASDVYSLGVILYELLTGHRPYRVSARTLSAWERAVCETEPPRPSSVVMRTVPGEDPGRGTQQITPPDVSAARGVEPERLRRRLRGDLDAVVMRALAKDPEQRYHSVRELADDMQRHLQGFPVAARGDPLGYRARKFVSRHRSSLAAVAGVVAALVVGLFAALWQAREAARQRDLAVSAASTMIFELAEGLSRMTGPTDARLGLLAQATAVFERIGGAGEVAPEHARRLADAYRTLAQTYTQLGDPRSAVRYASTAEQQARPLAGRRGAELRDTVLLASTLVDLGDALAVDGQEADAEQRYAEAISLLAADAPPASVPLDVYRWRYLALQRYADRVLSAGDAESADSLYRRMHAASAAMVARDSTVADHLRFHATSLERLADGMYYRGEVDASCAEYRRALDLRGRVRRLAPADEATLRTLAIAMQNVGWCSERLGDVQETVRLYTEAAGIQRRLMEADPSNVILARALMGGLGELGSTLRGQDRRDEALRHFRESLGVADTLRARGVVDPRLDHGAVQIAELLGEALLEAGELGEADRVLRQAIGRAEGLTSAAPENLDYHRALARLQLSYGDLALARGATATALTRYRQAVTALARVASVTGLSDDRQTEANGYFRLGRGLQRSGRLAEARQALGTARQILLDLRAAGQLSDASDGYRLELPRIESALLELGG